MGKVILASQNRNKIAELQAILDKYDMKVIPRDDAGLPKDEVEETGTTCRENSFIKAEAIRNMIKDNPLYEEYWDSPVVADDTGLMVDALDGAPGVYSARYAGEDCSYKDNYMKLLAELEGVPADKRTAHFETVITMIYPDGKVLVASGQCPGSIAEQPRGNEGFGYDPVYIPDGYDSTFAELGTETKNSISHRARALAELERLLG